MVIRHHPESHFVDRNRRSFGNVGQIVLEMFDERVCMLFGLYHLARLHFVDRNLV